MFPSDFFECLLFLFLSFLPYGDVELFNAIIAVAPYRQNNKAQPSTPEEPLSHSRWLSLFAAEGPNQVCRIGLASLLGSANSLPEEILYSLKSMQHPPQSVLGSERGPIQFLPHLALTVPPLVYDDRLDALEGRYPFQRFQKALLPRSCRSQLAARQTFAHTHSHAVLLEIGVNHECNHGILVLLPFLLHPGFHLVLFLFHLLGAHSVEFGASGLPQAFLSSQARPANCHPHSANPYACKGPGGSAGALASWHCWSGSQQCPLWLVE